MEKLSLSRQLSLQKKLIPVNLALARFSRSDCQLLRLSAWQLGTVKFAFDRLLSAKFRCTFN
ncbi:MAG TPA: hypothetical protein DCE56_09215 [Cyanobacteria bacterium UBA8553]|nr:hypothetical protein [Cyanobacteria bacterium UBA8553]